MTNGFQVIVDLFHNVLDEPAMPIKWSISDAVQI